MVDKTKIIMGFLTILLMTSIIYVTFSNQAKVRLDEDKFTFYIKENNRFVVSGREYIKMFAGSTKLYRDASNIQVWEDIDNKSNKLILYRLTPYKRGPEILEAWEFSSTSGDIEDFPVSHRIEVKNGQGYFLRYEVRDLIYGGKAKKLTGTNMRFGRNMKVEWQSPYRWARVYSSGILKVQYDILTDNEIYDVRLFDPLKACS